MFNPRVIRPNTLHNNKIQILLTLLNFSTFILFFGAVSPRPHPQNSGTNFFLIRAGVYEKTFRWIWWICVKPLRRYRTFTGPKIICRVVSLCPSFTIFKIVFCQVILNSFRRAPCMFCSVELINNKVKQRIMCAKNYFIYYQIAGMQVNVKYN